MPNLQLSKCEIILVTQLFRLTSNLDDNNSGDRCFKKINNNKVHQFWMHTFTFLRIWSLLSEVYLKHFQLIHPIFPILQLYPFHFIHVPKRWKTFSIFWHSMYKFKQDLILKPNENNALKVSVSRINTQKCSCETF